MAFNLSGAAAIMPGANFGDLLAAAPNFRQGGPFTDQLALDKELQSRMFNTAMEGGALIKQEKIRRDGLIEAAKIQSGESGGLGSRLAAVAGLLGSMGQGGDRRAGDAMALAMQDPNAPLKQQVERMQLARMLDQERQYRGQRSTIAGVAGLTGSQG